MPAATVVITTHNRSHLLPRAVESAHSSGSDLEIIVVDDASTDDTSRVCSRLADIKYVRLDKNGGLANARNIGIAESSCDFISFLDDDDLRLPNSIDKQLAVLHKHRDSAFCYGQALLGDAERQLPTGEIYPDQCPQGDIFWELLEHNFIPVPAVLTRRASLISAGGFNTDMKSVEDWEMWLRLCEVSPVSAIEEPLAIYRKAVAKSGQMCSNSIDICRFALKAQETALNRERARSGTSAQRRTVRQKLLNRLFEILMTEATEAIHQGDAGSARTKLRAAFRLRPLRTIASGRIPWLIFSKRFSPQL
jgi:Glycosyltransferases involved in cell wall biogenesis